MFRMVSVTVMHKAGPVDPAPLEPMVSQLAKEWVRLTYCSWLLWTDKSNVTVAEMMLSKLDAEDQIFVVGLDPADTAHGLVTQWIWDWWNLRRDPVTGEHVTSTVWDRVIEQVLAGKD